MARGSRSSKQPEFDPSELEDLIFTPAVGSGVGSHLVTSTPPAEPPTPVVMLEETTVVDAIATTVVENPVSIENTSHAEEPTVVDTDLATVVEESIPVTSEKSPVVSQPTVVDSPSIWVTEQGELVPGSRVKRIRLAQDVLNSAEESVYDTLWSARGSERDEAMARIVQAGYDYLMKRTRLSKKTIQRIVDRLIDKDFIAIERPADIYARTSTVYRVFSYRAVLDRQARKGRLHVVKIGPGFLYAHPLPDPRLNLTTVGDSSPTTVAADNRTTAARHATSTGPEPHPTTVVPTATKRIEQNNRGKTASSSAESAALRKLLEKHLGIVDDAASTELLTQCRARAGDCTIEEIDYFAGVKLQWARNIQNPVGFLLTSVPRHFENGGHLGAREFLRNEARERERRRQETYDYWREIATDPRRTEEERLEARHVLDSLAGD